MYSTTIMIHASNWREGLDWYQDIFPDSIRHQELGGEFEFISVGEIAIEVVQADSKVSSGCAGTVVYWQTEDFDARLSVRRQLSWPVGDNYDGRLGML